MPEVTERLLGKPTSIHNGGHEWRYRRKGSLAVHVGGDRAGRWKDHESGDAGGVLDLIERERGCDRAASMEWLEGERLIPAKSDRRRRRTGAAPTGPPAKAAQKPGERLFADSTSTPARTDEDRQKIAYAGRIWNAGVPADDTPGRIYASMTRWVWPGVEVTESPNLPEAVRWLSRETAQVRDPETSKPLLWLPPGAAGALLFAFTDAAGKGVAVQFEALTATGELVSHTDPDGQRHKRYERTQGRKDGYMRLSPRGPREPLLVLVEGPIDALAATWLKPGAVVWCCGGRLKFPADLPDGYAVRIEADGDDPGRTAAAEVRDALELEGVSVEVNWRTKGDLAEEWPDTLHYERIERAALLEIDGELTRKEAEAAAAQAWPLSRLWALWMNPKRGE